MILMLGQKGLEKELRSCTWRELETNGKFSKNDKN